MTKSDHKILIVSANSFVGTNLYNVLNRDNVYYTYNINKMKWSTHVYQLDVSNKKSVKKLLKRIKPDVIINLAAKRNVSFCENNEDISYKINVEGTKNLAEVGEKLNSKLIHFSTDLVFDGIKGNFKEDDKLNPLNVYGKHKQLSEQIIVETMRDYIILRPSYIYGYSDKSDGYVTWLIKTFLNTKLKHEFKKIKIANNQVVTPIHVEHICKIIIDMINNNSTGIYHVGEKCINKYDFSNMLKKALKIYNVKLIPVPYRELNFTLDRPLNNCLNISKIKKEIDFKEYTLHNGINKIIKKYHNVLERHFVKS